MAPVIRPEERQGKAGVRADRGALRAFALGDDPDACEAFIQEVKAAMQEPDRTTESRVSQLARLDLTARFNDFVRIALPRLMLAGATSCRHDVGKDALSYDDVPALAERLKLFMFFEVSHAKGRGGEKDVRVTQKTVRTWKFFLLKEVVRYVQEHESLDSIDRALRRVLQYTPSGAGGVYRQLSEQTAALIDRFQLRAHNKASGGYGAAEIQLLLNAAFLRLPTGKEAGPLLQVIALIQTCFTTGLRIGSLVASDKLDETRLGMRHYDVSFTTLERGAWTLHLHIRHMKGFNNPAKDSFSLQVRMRPLKDSTNILLEPTVFFLLLLIDRKSLRADGPDGPVIGSVAELLASPAHRFVGVGDVPMFRLSTGGEMGAIDASKSLGLLAANVGLPYASFHRIRHDFASQVQTLFGSAMARELLHHNTEHDALNRNYTGGMNLFDLIGLRTGESGQDSVVQATNREDSVLSGFAHRCVALDLEAEHTGDGDKRGLFRASGSVPSQTPYRRSHTPHKEQVQYALDNSPPFADLYRQYESAAARAEQLLGVALPFGPKPIKREPKLALGKLAATNPAKHSQAKAALERVYELRGSLQRTKRKVMRKYGEDGRKAKAKDVAGHTSAPISRGAMQQAQQHLKGRRPDLPSTVNLASGSDLKSHMMTLSSISAVADTAPVPRRAQMSTRDDQILDQMETMVQELDERQEQVDTDAGTFSQQQVIEGGSVEEQEETHDKGVRFRIAWLHFLEGISHAREREIKLLTFMNEAGFCPFCTFGRNKALPVIGPSQLGLDIACDRSNPNLHARNHLVRYHPYEITAIRAGKQLNPGVFQSPLMPIYAPNIYFQASAELAARFLLPLSADDYDRLGEAQKLWVRKHLEPSIYVDPSNASQVAFADKIVGKLLTSSLRPEGTTMSKWNASVRNLRAVSYPWPQHKTLFKYGPYSDNAGQRHPMPTMRESGFARYSELFSEAKGVAWVYSSFLEDTQLPEEVITMPLD